MRIFGTSTDKKERELLKDLYPVAYQAARRSAPTLTHEDWEDIASATLLAAREKLARGEVKTPKALVCRISANKAMDVLRSSLAEKRGSGNVVSMDEDGFQEPVSQKAGFVERLELAEAVELAFNALEKEDRAFAVDALNLKLSYRELARKYQLTEGRVGSRLNAVRNQMKPFLKDFLKK